MHANAAGQPACLHACCGLALPGIAVTAAAAQRGTAGADCVPMRLLLALNAQVAAAKSLASRSVRYLRAHVYHLPTAQLGAHTVS